MVDALRDNPYKENLKAVRLTPRRKTKYIMLDPYCTHIASVDTLVELIEIVYTPQIKVDREKEKITVVPLSPNFKGEQLPIEYGLSWITKADVEKFQREIACDVYKWLLLKGYMTYAKKYLL